MDWPTRVQTFNFCWLLLTPLQDALNLYGLNGKPLISKKKKLKLKRPASERPSSFLPQKWTQRLEVRKLQENIGRASAAPPEVARTTWRFAPPARSLREPDMS